MTTVYRLFNWRFNIVAFAADLERCDFVSNYELAALLGVDDTTISNWKHRAYASGPAPYPNMTNFMKVCNLLDLDPRNYFVLDFWDESP
jgi:hypothetical protein